MKTKKKPKPVSEEETREAVELLIIKEALARVDETDALLAETDALLAEADTVLARLRKNQSWTH